MRFVHQESSHIIRQLAESSLEQHRQCRQSVVGFLCARHVSFNIRSISQRKSICASLETVKVRGRIVRLLSRRPRGMSLESDSFLQELIRLERFADRSSFELKHASSDDIAVAGCDEAGAGCLAGPVVASAVVLPRSPLFEGLNDSKLVTPERRADIYRNLRACSGVFVGLGVVDVATIDKINVRNARLLAMKLALEDLWNEVQPTLLLVDGNVTLADAVLPVEQQRAVIGGDALHDVIAASSIIAKVTRDNLMEEMHASHPEYQFNLHKGYATSKHLSALMQYGPCKLHRRSFSPVQRSLRGS